MSEEKVPVWKNVLTTIVAAGMIGVALYHFAFGW